jgi:hypothetical protein
MEPPTHREQEMEYLRLASLLLKAVWSQIDSKYKVTYQVTIWTQVETNVAACARMTNSLHKFLSSLCGKFQVAVPGRDADERQFVEMLLRGQYGPTESILKALRDYPQICVLQLRVMNDQEKEERQQASVN